MNRYGSKRRAKDCLLSLQMAVYHAVHDYKGGVGAVAGVNGANAGSLQHKVNPNIDTHTVNLRDLQMICTTTQDERILQTVCSFYNAAYFLLPAIEGDNSIGVMKKLSEVLQDVTSLSQTVAASLEDGKVNADEVAELDKSLMGLMRDAKCLIESAKRAGGAA